MSKTNNKKTEIGSDSVYINGIEYIPKTNSTVPAADVDGLPFVCIRTESAGVHFGFLAKKESTLAGMEVMLKNSQRLRYWEGAMDLSVLSVEGSRLPEKSRASIITPIIYLVAIEIIPVTEKAYEIFKTIPIHN
jgi:hypothetical protein